MRFLTHSLLLGLCLLARSGLAVFATGADPEELMRAIANRESSAEQAETAREQQESLQAAARAKVEKIRNLPPDQIKAWTEGRISDEELNRFSAAPVPAADSAASAMKVPRSRLIRLELCGALVAVLGAAVWFRRRKERLALLADGISR